MNNRRGPVDLAEAPRRRVRRGSVVWWAWQIALPAGLLLWGVVMSVALLAWLSRGV